MSTHPSNLEARVKVLEHRQHNLEIHTEEVLAGMMTGVKQLSGDMAVVKANVKHLSNDMTDVKAEIKHLSGDMIAVKADVKYLSSDMRAVKSEIKHISNDITASFTQMVQYDMRIEGQIDARFNKIEVDIADIRATMATKDDIANIRANMATKDDIANMATKDDIAIINDRLNRLETAFGEHTTLLTQILERLPG